MIDRQKVEDLLDWMIDGAPPHDNPEDIIEGMCTKLVAAGIPVDRFVLFIYTLHPNIKGRRFKWEPGNRVEMVRAVASVFTSDMYHHNPLPQVIETRTPVRRRLAAPDCPDDFIIVDELREDGFTDYYAQPLAYMNGETNVATWASRSQKGITDEALEILDRVSKPLARLTETYLSYLNSASLLSAYVGHNVGDRILAGAIDRGSGEEIEAAILFVDLKQFTAMSNIHPGNTLIEALNRSLDALAPPVEAYRGEILKYLGDGFFAIFPCKSFENPGAAVSNAVCAAREGLACLRQQNAETLAENADGTLVFDVRTAIHEGRFYYGNIGGSAEVEFRQGDRNHHYNARLDFTAIGPDINYTARLLSAATELEADHVISEAAAKHLAEDFALAGSVPFKGFEGTQRVYRVVQ